MLSLVSSMAKNMVMRVHHALGLFCLMLLMQQSIAREFPVGGKGIWGVPADNTAPSYNSWAEKNRFRIGDSLVFNYASGQDSVLQVNKDAYTDCNTDNPIIKYTDGHTVFTFNQSGPHYFISGNKDNCNKNQKLVVIVLADRSNSNSNQTPAPQAPPSAASSTFISLVGSIGAFAASSLFLAF